MDPVPATEIPETVNISVPLLLSVTDFVVLWPIVTFPKLIKLGAISIETPVVAGLVPFPVTPTQPAVTTIASRVTAANIARKMDSRANCGERIAPFTRAPCNMGARVITTRIVRWGR